MEEDVEYKVKRGRLTVENVDVAWRTLFKEACRANGEEAYEPIHRFMREYVGATFGDPDRTYEDKVICLRDRERYKKMKAVQSDSSEAMDQPSGPLGME